MPEKLLVGADVGGTSVKCVVVDGQGEVLARTTVPTNPADAADTIARVAQALQLQLPAGKPLVGVGLACAGIVSMATGRLGRSPNLPGWEGADLLGAVGRAFGPVGATVANDVNAALYGDFRHGAGRGGTHLVMIALGTGVGGGVMVDRELVTGDGDGAGEIGHMTLELDGAPCPCGNLGCLEAYCGSVGLVRQARERAAGPDATAAWRELVASRAEHLTTRDCHELALQGDATARALFADAGRRLGQAAASLVNVLAPDRVIVGGGVAQAGDLLLEPCRQMIARHVIAADADFFQTAGHPFAAGLVVEPERLHTDLFQQVQQRFLLPRPRVRSSEARASASARARRPPRAPRRSSRSRPRGRRGRGRPHPWWTASTTSTRRRPGSGSRRWSPSSGRRASSAGTI